MHRLARAATVFAMTALLLLIAAPAFAHVTIRTDNPAPEAFAKYTIRVPNERDDAGTTQVEVELPEGFEAGNYQPVPGWDVEIADGVITISGGVIEPGQFQEFSFSARNPAEAGDLVFPSLQTYEGGEVVRWVGEPDSDEPAPLVTIEGDASGHGGHAATEAVAEPADAAAGTEVGEPELAAETSDQGSSILTWIAIVLSVVAIVVGGMALARGRNA